MKLKVLVADDSKSVRLLLKTCLEELGHEVISEVENGAEALLEYAKIKPDVVLMDVNMPLMNGIDSVRFIKASFKDAKIVMTTGESASETVREAIQAGAKYYILKPIKKEKVHEALEKLFQNTVKKEQDSGPDLHELIDEHVKK